MVDKQDDAAAQHYAVGLLTRREYSATELRQRLQRKGFATEVIDNVLEALRSQGWQSDVRAMAQRYRHARQSGHGPLRLQADLRQRGLSAAVSDADDSVKLDVDIDWQSVALSATQKKFPKGFPDSKTEQRAIRFLSGRGFDYATIRQAMEQWRRLLNEDDGHDSHY